jgi:branched-chain amino acid transport system permease protein
MKLDRTIGVLTAATAALLVFTPFLPNWAMFLFTVSLCYGVVVLLVRTGLVSFGHGLYYCLGAYAAGTLDPLFGITELAVMIGSAVAVTAVVSAVLALLLRKYRDIFFAMLSLAFSMILYGLLVKTSSLGSTDGFNVTVKTLFGVPIAGTTYERYLIFSLTVLICWICAVLIHYYLQSHRGRLAEAIRDNELRVEYMGASVANTIHLHYVMSAVLAAYSSPSCPGREAYWRRSLVRPFSKAYAASLTSIHRIPGKWHSASPC